VITDLSMPDEGGLNLMQWSQEHCPGRAWIVLTGHGTFDTAVKALQLGAFDFLEKPLAGVEPVRNAVRNALERQRLRADRDRLHAELLETNTRLQEHVGELEQAYHLLREQADNIGADLHRAGVIQRAMLPQVAPRLPGFQIHAVYRPSHSVGGDLYDVVPLDDRRAAIVVADAAGHGLSAAMLAVLFRSQLLFADPDSREVLRPRDTLRAVNRVLCEEFPAPGLFLTAAYCLLDTESRSMTVASAGHPPLLLLRRSGAVERIFHTGPALGLYPDAEYAQQEVVLDLGDRMLLYSDGLYASLPEDGRSPSEKIAAALYANGRGPEVLERLLAGSQVPPAQRDEAPEDDVMLLMLDATPGTSQLDNGTLRPLPEVAPRRARFEILFGSDSGRTTFSIQGSAEWARSAVFHARCVAAMEEGRGVVIDLTLCQCLDSTFIGTIHELCERAERTGLEFRLQGVTPPVEDLFEELGMKRVLERIVPRMLPLPTRMEPLVGEADMQSRALRVLRAHESLAALSERNRQEFDPLLEQLRRELAAPSR
jgi:serine phosphatase RsbU (regulator of sigma subunit)/anti-anti-sigma regulatory factor